MQHPLGEQVADTPGGVLRDGAALVLGQRGEDREKQLAGAVQGVDSLLLKHHPDAQVFEQPCVL